MKCTDCFPVLGALSIFGQIHNTIETSYDISRTSSSNIRLAKMKTIISIEIHILFYLNMEEKVRVHINIYFQENAAFTSR